MDESNVRVCVGGSVFVLFETFELGPQQKSQRSDILDYSSKIVRF